MTAQIWSSTNFADHCCPGPEVRVLLLGSSGFLGDHIGPALAQDETVELLRHFHQVPPRLGAGDAVRFDLSSSSADGLIEFFRRLVPDVIINAVGWTGSDPSQLDRLNNQLVQRLVAAASVAAPLCRFIQIGSAAEYGAGRPGVAVREGVEPHPTSAYGASKLSGSLHVIGAADRGELDGLVLRVFNPIGARMKAGSLPADAAARLDMAASAGAPVVRFGKLSDYRDFVDVRDVAAAVARAAGAIPLQSRVMNIGSGKATQVRGLVLALAGIAGFHGDIVEDDEGSHRSSAVPWQAADISRARQELAWQPRRPLEEALQDLFQSVVHA